VTACPTPNGPTGPAERCMGQKAVTRNRTGNPAEQSWERTTPVKAPNRRHNQPAHSGSRAGSKRARRRGRLPTDPGLADSGLPSAFTPESSRRRVPS